MKKWIIITLCVLFLLGIGIVFAIIQSNNEIKGVENVEKKQPLDLFKEFYELQNNQPMSREQADFMDKLIKDVWEVNE